MRLDITMKNNTLIINKKEYKLKEKYSKYTNKVEYNIREILNEIEKDNKLDKPLCDINILENYIKNKEEYTLRGSKKYNGVKLVIK